MLFFVSLWLNAYEEEESMKAITIVPGTTTIRLVDREEPTIVTPDEIKIQMRCVYSSWNNHYSTRRS